MNLEQRDGPSLVPLERVAMPTNESTDKATRRMIAQVNKTLIPRFSLKTNGQGIELDTMRFASLCSPDTTEVMMKAALRVGETEYQLPSDKPVEVISGMCLFGASGLSGVLTNNADVSLTDPYQLRADLPAKIASITESAFLHISEADTILRVAQALNILAANPSQTSFDRGIRGTFHLPVPEYQLYMLSLSQRGDITPEQFSGLMRTIERRANDLQKIVLKRVSIPLKFASPLDALKPLLAEKQSQTTLADCEAVLGQDTLFAELLKARPPKNLMDLCSLSYSAGYILTAEFAQKTGAGCLAVDIVEEAPILKNAKELCETFGMPLEMAAMYLPPFTVTNQGRNGKKALFMHDPNGASPLSELRRVIKNAQNTQKGNL